MESGRIVARELELAYERAGSGPDLIWGHGLTRSRATDDEWERVGGAALPVTSWRYDARGHGATSDPPRAGSFEWSELARDQLALADGLGIDTFVSSGASMGCATSLHVAVLAPTRVRALVLVIPPTAWESRTVQAARWRETAAVITADGFDAYLEQARLQPIPEPFRHDPHTYRRRAEDSLRRVGPDRLARAVAGAAFADLPPRQQIAEIDTPTLILAWTGDPVHPVATAHELAELIPDAELHVAESDEQLCAWPQVTRGFLEDALRPRPPMVRGAGSE